MRYRSKMWIIYQSDPHYTIIGLHLIPWLHITQSATFWENAEDVGGTFEKYPNKKKPTRRNFTPLRNTIHGNSRVGHFFKETIHKSVWHLHRRSQGASVRKLQFWKPDEDGLQAELRILIAVCNSNFCHQWWWIGWSSQIQKATK